MMTVRLINARSMVSLPFRWELDGWTMGLKPRKRFQARFVLWRSYKRNDENANQDAHDRQEDDDRDFEHGCLRG